MSATAAERAASGRAWREAAPRSIHALLEPPPDRDPLATLQQDDDGRIPGLVPVRYGRMLASPFAFYRGAASVMAADLAPLPRSGLVVQLCGDAHLSNFGGFASPDRALVFDLNDFDETLPGPFEWDVKRLAASFEIAGRDRGFGRRDRRAAVLAAVGSYREAMRAFAELGNLDVWYTRLDVEGLVAELRARKRTRRQAENTARAAAKARTKESMKALAKLTAVVDGRRRIVSDPPLLVSVDELADTTREETEQRLEALFRRYRSSLQPDRQRLLDGYRLVDAARKVVGVGSVGRRAWIAFLVGRDDGDPLFLQLKEARPSALERHLGASRYRNHARRVVEGQRLLQAAGDIFLGWLRSPAGIDGVARDFYVRQLWDWKVSVDADTILQPGLEAYAHACGRTLARAHARSGDRVAIASYLGKSDAFDRALAEFAAAYADLNRRDYETLAEAVRSGRIEADEER